MYVVKCIYIVAKSQTNKGKGFKSHSIDNLEFKCGTTPALLLQRYTLHISSFLRD